MFAGKIKTHNNINKKWARAKQNKNGSASDKSSDDNIGPEI